MTYHTTVLLHEGVEALNLKTDGVYVDATFGGGGHSNLILSQLDGGKLLAFDQDPDAERNAPADDRFVLCKGNFRFLKNFLVANGVDQVDGILADFGVSGHQFDEGSRGFSYRFDAELDMRMNPNQELDAKSVVNTYEEAQLRDMFHQYGETSYGSAVARRIVSARQEVKLERIEQLVTLVDQLVPERKRKSELSKIFQAIRIEVNDELVALKEFVEQSTSALKPGGRFVAISYHSLEDRPIKHFFRSGNFNDKQDKDLYGNINRPLNPVGKVVVPSKEEIEMNPRARSAKMRIADKNSNG
ncbi:MAG: 16S rRNA (cytosine(1402)-N(4))-methyltransferase RsmH [Flavobacteriales bacterium]|jgi:16S rRNA (cytosine1402-N4)-methyltransferase|nr:16S rRNA (cytosine(1402)-N(4))-methyltransferase RsmH [Flavobacteriales bacterium]